MHTIRKFRKKLNVIVPFIGMAVVSAELLHATFQRRPRSPIIIQSQQFGMITFKVNHVLVKTPNALWTQVQQLADDG